MSGKKKTNGDEQCKCRLSSLAPHRKKKCSLFGKNGFLVPPDTQIQHAKALDKEVDEEEVDQSPEAVRARIEKAVTDAAGPGVNVTVTVTIETSPQPPTPPTDSDAGTSTEAGPASPPPVPASELDASAGGLTLDGGTQYDEHDLYANSPLADPNDHLLAGLDFGRSVSLPASPDTTAADHTTSDNNTTDTYTTTTNNTTENTATENTSGGDYINNSNEDCDDDGEDVYHEARGADSYADNDATESFLGGFDFVSSVPADDDDEGEPEHDTVVQI